MPLNLNAKVDGKNRISARFNDIERGLKNFREPLTEANKYMLGEIDKNFNAEGGVVTKKWTKLSPKYETIKKRKYGDVGILHATGRMRAAFKSKIDRKKVVISNTAEYFEYHQSSAPRRKLPRRVMLDITRKQQAEIFRFFTKYLNKITNG